MDAASALHMTIVENPTSSHPIGDATPPAFGLQPRPLEGTDAAVLALTAVFILVFTVPCLPPTIGLGDFGDLQLAAWRLGIAHPPGYPIYAAVLHPFTWLPGLEPAYAVSLGCLLLTAAALLMCAVIQIRLGVNAWIAGATIVGLCLYRRVQLNLVAPEVYGVTLLFLAVALYLTLRFTESGRTWMLYAAGLCYGVTVVSRPPMAFMFPFTLMALLYVARRMPALRRGSTWIALACAGLAPTFLSMGYVLLRDRPGADYNYIAEFNKEGGTLPEPEAGVSARLHRMAWLMSARQFNNYVGIPLRDLPKKAVWLGQEIVPYSWIALVATLGLCAYGAVRVFRASDATGWLLCGMVFQSLLYTFVYRVHGQAADLLPLQFAMGIFGGAAVTVLLTRVSIRRANWLGFSGFILTSLVTATEPRLCRPSFADGTRVVEGVDMATMPEGAVVVTEWESAAPLRYARLRANRKDITLLTIYADDWKNVPPRFPNRAVYVNRLLEDLKTQYDLVPFRSLFLLRNRSPE